VGAEACGGPRVRDLPARPRLGDRDPLAGLIPYQHPRATPYLFTDTDLAALLAAAGTLRYQLAAATYRALLGLLITTGLRVGEAINLDRADLGLDDDLLLVRGGKFGKDRIVPTHPATTAEMARYLDIRDDLLPGPRTLRC